LVAYVESYWIRLSTGLRPTSKASCKYINGTTTKIGVTLVATERLRPIPQKEKCLISETTVGTNIAAEYFNFPWRPDLPIRQGQVFLQVISVEILQPADCLAVVAVWAGIVSREFPENGKSTGKHPVSKAAPVLKSALP